MRQVKTDYIRKTHSHVTFHIFSWSPTADYFTESMFGFSQVASVSRNNDCVRAFEWCPQQRRRTEGLKLVERVRTFMRVFWGGDLLGTMFDIEEQGLWCTHGDILVFRSPLHHTEEKEEKLPGCRLRKQFPTLKQGFKKRWCTFCSHLSTNKRRIYLTGGKLVPQSHIKGLIYNAKMIMSGRVSLAKKRIKITMQPACNYLLQFSYYTICLGRQACVKWTQHGRY